MSKEGHLKKIWVRYLAKKIEPVGPALMITRKERILVAHTERATDQLEKNRDDLNAWVQFRGDDGQSIQIIIRGNGAGINAIKRMFRHFDPGAKKSCTNGIIAVLLAVGDVAAEGLEDEG